MRILFVKTSSLGDVIHHCPAVSDAARALPGARIDWVVEEAFADVAQMHRSVRRVIPVALRRWRRAPWRAAVREEFAQFRRALAAERYDRIVDTQGLMKSALIARLAKGARHGFDRGSAREPFAARLYAARHPVSRKLHAVERNRQLSAAALGYAVDGPCDYGLRATAAAPLAIAEPFAVLLTMTSRADKLWSERHWIALGAKLAGRGLRCVLPWGSERERARSMRIAASVAGALVPQHLSVGEIGALIARARAVVGVDTGLTHLGVALGVPSIGIYCASSPALTGLHGSPRARNVGGVGEAPGLAAVLAAFDEVA